jgi:hypothetical protein
MKFFKGLLIFLIISGFTINAFALENEKVVASGDAYFDIATGHKYIKNSETTFIEYSKKGKLLKNSVPNDLPLLTRSKYIREIRQNWYFVYQKRQGGIMIKQVLPASHGHPEGWSCEKGMSSVI